MTSPHISGKPDIVYLWVNGQDPVWNLRRSVAEKKYYGPQSCRFSNVEGRFRDNDELRYSLRSLIPYLEYFGHIYIVTDDQRPAWLSEHDRISVLDHSALRGEDESSTYSSKAIEACFDRLPSTNDIIYLNDDVFLGGAFLMEDLFNTKLQKTLIHFEQFKDRDPLHDVSQNLAMDVSHDILANHYIRQNFRHKPMAHAPRYLIREHMHALFSQYPDAVKQAREEVFREPSRPSVIADLYGRWMLATGNAMEQRSPHALLSSGSPLINQQLTNLLENFNQLSYFCINDTLDNSTQCHANFPLIQSVLEDLFPTPSEFEMLSDSKINAQNVINRDMSP